MLQTLCMKRTAPTQLFEAFISEFEDINDFRVSKLAFGITTDQTSNLEGISENQVLNAILDANEPRTLRIAARFINDFSAPNPWDYIYAGWATSEGMLKEPKNEEFHVGVSGLLRLRSRPRSCLIRMMPSSSWREILGNCPSFKHCGVIQS